MGAALENKMTIRLSDHMQIDLEQFRIRCSAIGEIMGEPRGKSTKQKIADLEAQMAKKQEMLDKAKSDGARGKIRTAMDGIMSKIAELRPYENEPNLSDTCKTYLYKWVNERLYYKPFQFASSSTTKGTLVEDEAIFYASCHVPGMEMATKNDEYFQDEWMHGTPDIIEGNCIFDNKSSFTHDTFPLYEAELPETDYDWQVTGYIHLANQHGYNIEKGAIVYTLMSMPDTMIRTEARRRLGPDYTLEEYEEFAAHFKYDDFPPYLRIKVFDVPFDAEKIEAVKKRVLECRDFIAQKIVPMIEANAKRFQ